MYTAFFYRIDELSRSRSGYAKKMVTMYGIKDGLPVELGKYDYSCESDFQAAFNCLVSLGLLEEKLLEKNPNSGWYKYGSAVALKEEAGITVVQV